MEDPETSKTISFMDALLKHDNKQFNDSFPTKATAHTRANSPLSNDHLSKETDSLEKNAADMMGGLRKLVSAIGSKTPKGGQPASQAPVQSNTAKLRAINPNVDKMIKPKGKTGGMVAFSPDQPQADIKTPQAGTAAISAQNVPSEALRTDQQKAVDKKPKTEAGKRTSVDGTPPVMTQKNQRTSMDMKPPQMTQKADATQYNLQAPMMTQKNQATMANSPIQPNSNMITPNVTTADLQSVKPIAPADGKRFGAQPFDPNGTMKNRAISPDIPRGAPTPPVDPRFGAIPFDPNSVPNAPMQPQQVAPQMQGATAVNAPIQPQMTPTLPNTPLQPQGPAAGVVQPNTQNINAAMGALGPQGTNPIQPGMNLQGQAQGMVAPNTQDMNAIQGALGPQKQNNVDPSASAAQQAAQAQQQPKIVNNTMKPPAPPKPEATAKAEPASAAAKPVPGSKEKAQLERMKQKSVVDKLHQRLQTLESAAKEKAAAPAAEKPVATEAKKTEPIKAKPDQTTKEMDAATEKKTEPIKPSTVAKEKSGAPEKKDESATKKVETQKPEAKKLNLLEQAANLRNDKSQDGPKKPEPESPIKKSQTPKKSNIDIKGSDEEISAKFEEARRARARAQGAPEPAPLGKKTQPFDRMEDGKTAPYDRMDNANTSAIKPKAQEGADPNRASAMNAQQRDSLREESSNAPQKQTGRYEKVTQDNGEAQGRAQSGQDRNVNYAVGYKGDAEKPKRGIAGRIGDAIKGKVDQIRGNSDSKKPKSVQQMDAIPTNPYNAYADKPKVNIPSGQKPKAGTSPITGDAHPHSPEGQSKIKEHLMGALGESKAQATKKWESMSPEHQKGVMLGATLLAATGLGVGMSRRSKRKKAEAKEERMNEMRQMMASQQGGYSGGGYSGGGYGRY